jgi:hypothetical protein
VTTGPVNESFRCTANLIYNSDHLDTWRTTASAGPGDALPVTALAERRRQTWSL